MAVRIRTRLFVALMTSAYACPTIAQTAAPAGAPVAEAEPPVQAPQATGQAAAQAGEQLGDIIVTATRREENLQKTALPITTLSGDAIAQAGITQPETLSGKVAGLSISPNGAVSQVFLRGVGTVAIAGYTDSAVAFNVDGVFYAFPAQYNGSFYDVGRIEVLKGPQGTLYGRNASAGAINVVTNRPTFELEGSGTIEIGSYDLRKVDGAINLPLSDRAAVRVAGQLVRRDGYFSDGLGNDDSDAMRVRFLYEPTDTVKILIGGDYTRTGGTGTPSVVRPFADPDDPYAGPTTAASNGALTAFNATLPPSAQVPLNTAARNRVDVHAYGLHAQVDADLGFATLTVLPAVRWHDDTSSRFPGFVVSNDDQGDQTSLELRLASGRGGKLTWIVGGYYLDSRYTNLLRVDQGTNIDTGDARQTSLTFAGFAEATYSLSDRFRVTAGARYTSERKQQFGTYDTTFTLPPIPLSAFDLAGSKTYRNVSYKAGAEFDLAERSLAYATVSRGFKAGGFNLDRAPNSYEPELLTAYTLGVKNRFLDNRLQVNVEAFYWDYNNHQEIFLQALNAGGSAPQVVNVGKSTLYGLNADLEFLVTSNDLLTAQVEYLHARLDEFVYVLPDTLAPIQGVSTTCVLGKPSPGLTSVDCSGKDFTRAPKFTVNLGYQHIVDLAGGGTIVAAIDTQLKTSQELTIDYIEATRQEGYSLTNVNLSYTTPSKTLTVAAYVRNLEDSAILSSAFQRPRVPGLVYGTLRAPRTYGASASVRF